jgi:hypothetical protein
MAISGARRDHGRVDALDAEGELSVTESVDSAIAGVLAFEPEGDDDMARENESAGLGTR